MSKIYEAYQDEQMEKFLTEEEEFTQGMIIQNMIQEDDKAIVYPEDRMHFETRQHAEVYYLENGLGIRSSLGNWEEDFQNWIDRYCVINMLLEDYIYEISNQEKQENIKRLSTKELTLEDLTEDNQIQFHV